MTMSKLKVGTKVVVTSPCHYAKEHIVVGKRGTVSNSAQPGRALVTWDDGGYWYFSDDGSDGMVMKARQEFITTRTPTFADDLSITPKARTILAHLKSGKSITPAEALIVYSQPRLASAIHEIRRIGYVVKMEQRTDEGGHRYARYTIEKPTVH